jgi:hypothetical protein
VKNQEKHAIAIPISGRVLIKFEMGNIVSSRQVSDDEVVMSIEAIREVLERAGFVVFPPDKLPN